MPPVKKTEPFSKKMINPEVALDALKIQLLLQGNIDTEFGKIEKISEYIDKFESIHKCSYEEIIDEIWFWKHQIQSISPAQAESIYLKTLEKSDALEKHSSESLSRVSEFSAVLIIYEIYSDCFGRKDTEPIKIDQSRWVFKEFIYEVNGFFTDDQFRLLIFEEFDKERKRFERLKNKFDTSVSDEINTYSRPRLKENVRIEVWRRDGGKCAKCGSREKLEYDHIIPVSRGGSNTTRNIELLCEKCNRSKSNKIE